MKILLALTNRYLFIILAMFIVRKKAEIIIFLDFALY